MDGDRKYKQRGYSESSGNSSNNNNSNQQKPRSPQGPRPSIDITGPRLPRLVQTVTASRCYNCATTLPTGIDFQGNCPKCNAALHCCKQCAHFEPSTRFQCLKPIPVRIAYKDQVNDCDMFSARVTVAREASQQGTSSASFGAHAALNGNGGFGGSDRPSYRNGGGDRPPYRNGSNDDRPRTAQDARAAFDSLFKK